MSFEDYEVLLTPLYSAKILIEDTMNGLSGYEKRIKVARIKKINGEIAEIKNERERLIELENRLVKRYGISIQ